jgi:hypothetical protein
MSAIRIESGPAKNELLSRMLSYLPVTFVTTGGPFKVLIDEMQETGINGQHFSFKGRIVSGVRADAQVHGSYACSTKTGKLEWPADGH